jgi:hypothetical protein
MTLALNPFAFDLNESLPKSLMSGVTYAAGTMLVFSDDITAVVTIPLLEIEVPMPVLSFVAGVIGSLSGDLAAAALFPLIPADERIKNGSIALTDALISGSIECTILKVLAGVPFESFPKLLAFSAGHNMANEYLYASVLGDEGFAIF